MPATKKSRTESSGPATTVKAYGAKQAKAPLDPMEITRRAPLEDDVAIKILFCGVCHTDIHFVNNDWGGDTYPVVPGHEIVGEVTAVGAKVTRFKVGDKVGVGCMVDSCLQPGCDACKLDMHVMCDNCTLTYAKPDERGSEEITYGGYSESVVVREEFVFRMPDNLDLAEAAPLLCAGITTYSPLRYWKVGEGSKVGIIGLGGLGHIAVKLAKAMGAEVTVFTRTDEKQADAKSLGGDHVVLSTDKEQMKSVEGKLNVILDTVPEDHDVMPYIQSLALNGALVVLGRLGPLSEPVSTKPLLLGRRCLTGSFIGGIKETQELLDFCGEHNIACQVEKIPVKDINEAFSRMQKGEVRYRYVIDNSTF